MKIQMKAVISLVVSGLLLGVLSGCTKVSEDTDVAVSNIVVASDNSSKPNVDNIKVEVSEKKLETDNEYFKSSVKYPIIIGLEDKSIESKINDMFEKDAVNFGASVEDNAKKDFEAYQKDKSYPFHKYEADTQFEVKYNKNNILSIAALFYQYTGGAHGGTMQVGYNIDLNTGKIMSLADLFDKDFNYKEVISNDIISEIQDNPGNYFTDAVDVVKDIKETQPYYIEDGNIVIYYSEYEIAPYAAGIPEFRIPVDKLKFAADLKILK